MSYIEAKEDNIPTEKDCRGFTIYYPPCHICETPVFSWRYVRNTKYTCPNCRELLVGRQFDMKLNNCLSKQERCLNRAIDRISKQTNIKKYESAIAWIRKHLGNSSWFQSTEEVMVAMELIRKGVKAHHQVKVYNYSVDFVLPDLKVALEIDGKLYHGKDKEKYSEERDMLICDKLGEGWEIIHIDTDNINRNVTKLMVAINAVLRRRKKIKTLV